MTPGTAARLLIALAVALHAAPAAAQVAPPHLDILEASIREVPPLDPFDVASRMIAVDLTLTASPACTGSSPFTSYGILVDADLDPGTGTTHAAFAPLGVDARISAECQQSTGQFVSRAGTVVVGTPGAGGETLLTITTMVSHLPAVEFGFVAFAMEGGTFTRLPAAPERAGWAIHERSLP